MKKLLLGLGSIAAVATPVVAVVSYGDKEEDQLELNKTHILNNDGGTLSSADKSKIKAAKTMGEYRAAISSIISTNAAYAKHINDQSPQSSKHGGVVAPKSYTNQEIAQGQQRVINALHSSSPTIMLRNAERIEGDFDTVAEVQYGIAITHTKWNDKLPRGYSFKYKYTSERRKIFITVYVVSPNGDEISSDSSLAIPFTAISVDEIDHAILLKEQDRVNALLSASSTAMTGNAIQSTPAIFDTLAQAKYGIQLGSTPTLSDGSKLVYKYTTTATKLLITVSKSSTRYGDEYHPIPITISHSPAENFKSLEDKIMQNANAVIAKGTDIPVLVSGAEVKTASEVKPTDFSPLNIGSDLVATVTSVAAKAGSGDTVVLTIVLTVKESLIHLTGKTYTVEKSGFKTTTERATYIGIHGSYKWWTHVLRWRPSRENHDTFAEIHINENTKVIPSEAFAGVELPEGFRLPNSVTEIEYSSFSGATLPMGFVLPTSITTIGQRAFKKVVLPSGFTLPNSITSLLVSTFEGATIPAGFSLGGVTEIHGETFKNAKFLGTLDFSKIIEIFDDAFLLAHFPVGFAVPISTSRLTVGAKAFDQIVIDK